MSLADSKAVCLTFSGLSTGFTWLPDTRCVSASRIPSRNYFVSANPQWSSFEGVDDGGSCAKRNARGTGPDLVSRVSQRGTRSLSRQAGRGGADGSFGNGHDD